MSPTTLCTTSIHRSGHRSGQRWGGATRAVARFGAVLLAAVGVVVVAGTSGPASASGPHVTWTTGNTKVPNAHLEGAAVAVGQNIYDISGSTQDCTDGVVGPTTAKVDVYHPAGDSFGTAPPIPNPRQGSPLAAAVGTNIYVIGGWASCGGSAVAPVDVFHTAGAHKNTWSTLPASSDLPAALQGPANNDAAFLCGTAVGSKIYYFGLANIGVLNTAASPPKWTVLTAPASPPLSVFSHAVRVGRKITIAAGDGSPDALSMRVLDYHAGTNTLTQRPLTTIGWAEESAVVFHKKIVLSDGDFNGQDQVQIITKNTVVTDAVSPKIRDDAEGGSVVGTKIYIVGGQSGVGGTTPTVLIGTPNW